MIDSRIVIGLIAVLISMVVMAILGIHEQDRMVTFEASQKAKAIQNGAVIYEEACAECHGQDGQGVLGRAPALNTRNFFENRLEEINFQGTLEAYVTLTVASGRPVSTDRELYSAVMPTWSEKFGGPYRDDQVRDVTAFVLNWAPGLDEGAAAEAAASDNPVVRGRALFTQVCATCHTVDGVSTGQVGPNLTNIYAEKGRDYVYESIVDPNAVIAEGFAPNIMQANLSQLLTDEQIEDIIAFLENASQ